MNENELEELKRRSKTIEQAAKDLGLLLYPQEFVCEYDPAAFIALVSHNALSKTFGNWHFGREFENLELMNEWGVQRYAEVAVNVHPSRAHLLMTNPLALQLVVIAHVYGHNNFSRINQLLSSVNQKSIFRTLHTDALLLEKLKEEGDAREINNMLDAARFACWHKDRSAESAYSEDILRCLLENAGLPDEKRKVVNIIVRWSDYLYPQRITKLLNEGWATLVQRRVLERAHQIEPFPEKLWRNILRHDRQIASPPTSFTALVQNPHYYWLGRQLCEYWEKELGSIRNVMSYISSLDDDIALDYRWPDSLDDILIEVVANQLDKKWGGLTEEQQKAEKDALSFIANFGVVAAIRKFFGRQHLPHIIVRSATRDSTTFRLELEHIFAGDYLHFKYARKALLALRKYLWPTEHGKAILYTYRKTKNGTQAVQMVCDGERVKTDDR